MLPNTLTSSLCCFSVLDVELLAIDIIALPAGHVPRLQQEGVANSRSPANYERLGTVFHHDCYVDKKPEGRLFVCIAKNRSLQCNLGVSPRLH